MNARKTKKKKRSIWKVLLIVLIILIAAGGVAWYGLASSLYGRISYEETGGEESALRQDGVTNILLIGNDSRENGEDGRSDAMILLSISEKTRTVQMISFLRDMYVEIPGHDGNRLNAAYAYGGPELLMETVRENFQIPVSHYVLVNFEAFANLVDAVGGVDLELTSEEVEYVNGYLVEYNQLTGRPEGTDYLDTSRSGLIHLNGPQALAYTRNRYIGTDFGRTERQRKVLSAVIGELPKALLTNPQGVLDGLLSNLTTNLTRGEFLRLTLDAGKLFTYDLQQGSVPVEGSYQNATIRGMAVLEVDFEQNIRYLNNRIYGE
ncbi:MAG TPA: LCP family protein [Candidatus Eisenbergiella pullicola]|nr:LCP family protein [Candidatus Eisenbergiella pullicola]